MLDVSHLWVFRGGVGKSIGTQIIEWDIYISTGTYGDYIGVHGNPNNRVLGPHTSKIIVFGLRDCDLDATRDDLRMPKSHNSPGYVVLECRMSSAHRIIGAIYIYEQRGLFRLSFS